MLPRMVVGKCGSGIGRIGKKVKEKILGKK